MSGNDPAFEEWINRARDVPILEAAQRAGASIKRAGRDWVGPCPACGGTDRFVISPANREQHKQFMCRNTEGGDVIAMAMHCMAVDFMGAVEWLTGDPPPRGEGRRVDQDVIRERRDDRLRDRIEGARDMQEERTRKIETARDVWEVGRDILGTLGDKYFKQRGIILTPDTAADLRFVPSLEYRGWASPEAGEQVSLGSYPCVTAALRNVDGDLIACHRIYLDADGWKLKPPGDPGRNKAKKILGKPTGGMIRLGLLSSTLAIGEGIETALAWLRLYDGNLDVSVAAAYSLGNLAGAATDTLPHPSDPKNPQARIPNGIPDMERPGVILPPEIEQVIILGDGDSDPVRTRAMILTAARRWRSEGRVVQISFAPAGKDWNDALAEQIEAMS
jgi:hypothetical protein